MLPDFFGGTSSHAFDLRPRVCSSSGFLRSPVAADACVHADEIMAILYESSRLLSPYLMTPNCILREWSEGTLDRVGPAAGSVTETSEDRMGSKWFESMVLNQQALLEQYLNL